MPAPDDTQGLTGHPRTTGPFYRDEAHFHEVLDEASRRIQTRNVVGFLVIWAPLFALTFQVLCLVGSLVFGWDPRQTLLPGIDLVGPLWWIVVGPSIRGWRIGAVRLRPGR